MTSGSNSDHTQPKRKPLSRRAFLKGTGLIAAATGAGSVLAGCAPGAGSPKAAPTPVLTLEDKYLNVPPAPVLPPDPLVLQFLSAEEAHALDAIVSRLIPGDAQDPGAHEAGVVTFIDNMLANTDGWAEPTYLSPPYAKVYEGDAPPAGADQDPDTVWIPKDRASDYGWQAAARPQELYRAGLASLAKAAGASLAGLADMSDDALDALLKKMEAGKLNSFDSGIPMFSDKAFFQMLLTHTYHGMFGDPLYGGNRYLVGWQLVDYPGSHRAYTPQDLLTEGTPLDPQSLANLPPFHPGQPVSDDVIIPVANGDLIQQQVNRANAAERLLFCQLQK